MSDFAHSPTFFEPLIDSDHAAAIVRVHPKTLPRYARNGIVNGIRLGKLWRFRASDLLLQVQKIEAELPGRNKKIDDDDKAE